MKEHLKRKWKQIFSDYKKAKKPSSATKTTENTSQQKANATSTPMRNVTLPYIPGGR